MEENIQEIKLILKTVELQNFRCFEEINLAFDERLTVLIGVNGSGKTALVEGIAGLLQPIVHAIKSEAIRNVIEGYSTKDVRNGTLMSVNQLSAVLNDETPLDWYAELSIAGYEAGAPEIQQEDEYTQEEEEQRSDDKTARGANARVHDNEGFSVLDKLVSNANKSLIRNLEVKSNENPVSLPVLMYYPCRKIGGVYNEETLAPHNFNNPFVGTYHNALSFQTFDFKTLEKWFRWKENVARQTQIDRELQFVKEVVLSFLNDDDGQQQYTDLATDYLSNPPEGELFVIKNETRVYLNQLSSGERNMLGLITDLARRLIYANPGRERPLAGSGIVLIDEIDLHLHPRWQRAILPKLMKTFPNIQWVVTTHSPLVISNYEILPEQVFLITEEEETLKKMVVSLDKLQLNTSGVEPNTIYEDVMQVKLRDEKAKAKIEDLKRLLNPLDYEKPETQALIGELTTRFGTDDMFIRKVQHQLKLFSRRKALA